MGRCLLGCTAAGGGGVLVSGVQPEQDVSEQDVNERTAGLMELHTPS